MKKLYRSCTALLLAMCLILGLCGAGVQASAAQVPEDLPVDQESVMGWAKEVLNRALAINLHDEDSAMQIKDLVADIVSGTEAQLDVWENYADEKEKELDEAVADADAKLEEADQKVADAEEQIADAEVEIAEAQEDLNEAWEKVEEKQKKLDEAQGSAAKEEAQKELDDAKAELTDAQQKLDDAKAKLADGKAKVADAKQQIADARKQKDEAVATAEDALAKLRKCISGTRKALDEVKPYANVVFDNAQPALDKLVALNDALNKLIHEGCNAAARELQTAIYDVCHGTAVCFEKVTGKSADKLVNKAAKAKNELDKMYIEATQTTMSCVDLTKFVALGDANAYGPSADKLADMIQKYLGKQPESYKNLTAPNQTAAQLLANLDSYKAELSGASLITLSFNTNAFSKYAFDQAAKYAMGKEVSCNWGAYVGEEFIAYVEEAKAELFAKLEAKGYKNATAAVVLAESYAFAYAQHILAYYPLVKQIQTLNPEAQIVLVGMHNPMEDVAMDFHGLNLPVGDFMRCLTDISNIYSLGYAMLSEGKIFVDAFEVEIDTTVDSMLDRKPTDAGYTTIAQNIWNALGIQNHEYEDVVTAPTCTEDGYTTHTCSCCGHSYVDSKVDALGHDWVLVEIVEDGEWYECSRCGERMFIEYTGDMISIVIALLAVSGLGITVLKKKEF